MSDRVLIVRVMGLGSLLTDEQLVLTSRGTLPYLDRFATLPGVVADLGDQFSSEIGFFESMGSDPSTAFSVLSTAETRAALLGRRKVPVYDVAMAPVVTTSYVPPLFSGVTIGVSDTSGMFAGQRIRIGTIAWRVDDVPDATNIVATRIWGSPRTPIPMILSGEAAVGMVVYDLLLSTGSVEGLPIVVSTAEITATSRAEEEVIYRGQIVKVGVDTSKGAANQISVQCGSLMGYLRNAPFRPPIAATAQIGLTADAFDQDVLLTQAGWSLGALEVTTNVGVYGAPTWNGGETRTPTATSMRAWQIRDGGRGCGLPYRVYYGEPGPVVTGQVATMTFSGWGPYQRDGVRSGGNWLYVFDSSFYASHGASPITDSMVSLAMPFNDRQYGQSYNVTSPCEGSFVCASYVTPELMLQDLMLGTVDGLLSGDRGWRSATEAAWLPYSEAEGPTELVDWASLSALLQGRDDVFPITPGLQGLRPLPYDAGNAKTVGDVLGLILKRLGGFMVYDRGKLRFGSWAVNNPIPTVVTDAALAEPTISLDFDRTACLQAVEVEAGTYRWRNDSGSDARSTIKRPITNLDLGAAGIGKVASMGCFVAFNEGLGVVNQWITGSSWFATATQAVVRYSQPAARVVVTYRDAVRDLTVGETVAFSTAFLPSATGAMGVELAVGIVLKAARSWKTPTTEYTLLLFGYTQATATKVPLIAASALATGPAVGDKVPIAPAYFTRGAAATGGAPTSDAEAWVQSATILGVGDVPALLCDTNGTYLAGPDQCYGAPGDSTLRFPYGPPFGGYAITAGMVIIIATNAGGWDALQADATGSISGDPTRAYPWGQ